MSSSASLWDAAFPYPRMKRVYTKQSHVRTVGLSFPAASRQLQLNNPRLKSWKYRVHSIREHVFLYSHFG